MPKTNYVYTRLNTDGTREVLHTGKKWGYAELREAVGNIIEVIPDSYYPPYMDGTAYGDEEARLRDEYARNPHFVVLKDLMGEDWDIIGDIILEQTERQNKKYLAKEIE